MSSERQLHYVLSQVAASSEVESPNIKSRMSGIIKGEWSFLYLRFLLPLTISLQTSRIPIQSLPKHCDSFLH